MNNKVLAEMIREKYYEEKMSAEYKLQLNKSVEMEAKSLKDFTETKGNFSNLSANEVLSHLLNNQCTKGRRAASSFLLDFSSLLC